MSDETLASYMDSLGLSATKPCSDLDSYCSNGQIAGEDTTGFFTADCPRCHGTGSIPLSDEEVEAAIRERFPHGAIATGYGWADAGSAAQAERWKARGETYRTRDDLLAHARHLAGKERDA